MHIPSMQQTDSLTEGVEHVGSRDRKVDVGNCEYANRRENFHNYFRLIVTTVHYPHTDKSYRNYMKLSQMKRKMLNGGCTKRTK